MKVKPDFELRTVAGENIIVATGKTSTNFAKLISLNNSAAYLWKEVSQLPSFDNADVADLLVKQYQISHETALFDATELTKNWIEAGIVEA